MCFRVRGIHDLDTMQHVLSVVGSSCRWSTMRSRISDGSDDIVVLGQPVRRWNIVPPIWNVAVRPPRRGLPEFYPLPQKPNPHADRPPTQRLDRPGNRKKRVLPTQLERAVRWESLFVERIETRPLICPFTCPAMFPLPNPCRIVHLHQHRRTLPPSNDIDRVPRTTCHSFVCLFTSSITSSWIFDIRLSIRGRIHVQ